MALKFYDTGPKICFAKKSASGQSSFDPNLQKKKRFRPKEAFPVFFAFAVFDLFREFATDRFRCFSVAQIEIPNRYDD